MPHPRRISPHTRARPIGRARVIACGQRLRPLSVCALFAAAVGACAPPSPTTPATRTRVPSEAPVLQDLAVRGAGAPVHRIPALAVSTRGTLLAAWDGRPTLADVPSHIAILMRRSEDSGRTWSPLDTVRADTAPLGFGDPSLLVDRTTGRVFLFHAASVRQGFFGSSTAVNDDDPEVLHADVSWSDDDGRTWQHRRLTSTIKREGWGGLFAASGAGVQLARGAHAGRLLQPFVVRLGQATYAAVLRSDDHGATWQMGELVGPDADEAEVAERADGTVVLNARARPFRRVAISRDRGVTFDAPVADTALVDPGNNAGLLAVPAIGDDALLLSHTADSTTRRRLVLRRSCDGGRHWQTPRILVPEAAAYSTLALLPSGDIGVLFERGAYDAITFARVPRAWLGACP